MRAQKTPPLAREGLKSTGGAVSNSVTFDVQERFVNALERCTMPNAEQPAGAGVGAGGTCGARLPAPPSAPDGLPCLSSNNSTEGSEGGTVAGVETLSPTAYHRRAAFVLEANVKEFVRKFGINHCGFLTLTFPDQVEDFREAQERFNSLATHYLRERFGRYVCVVETQKSGRIHYHLLVTCQEDIRTGFDFEACEKRDYRSASDYLRGLWSDLRETMPKFGFGRSELLPIRTTAGGIANYVGKYLGKAITFRREDMGKARLVRYSQGWRVANAQFAWAGGKGPEWRAGLEKVGKANGAKDYEGVRALFGSRWAWYLMETMNRRNIVKTGLHLVDRETARDIGFEMLQRVGRPECFRGPNLLPEEVRTEPYRVPTLADLGKDSVTNGNGANQDGSTVKGGTE